MAKQSLGTTVWLFTSLAQTTHFTLDLLKLVLSALIFGYIQSCGLAHVDCMVVLIYVLNLLLRPCWGGFPLPKLMWSYASQTTLAGGLSDWISARLRGCLRLDLVLSSFGPSPKMHFKTKRKQDLGVSSKDHWSFSVFVVAQHDRIYFCTVMFHCTGSMGVYKEYPPELLSPVISQDLLILTL